MKFKFSKTDKSILSPTHKNGHYLLHAASNTEISPKTIGRIPTGIRMEFPSIYFAQVTGVYNESRSFITVVDSDFRGEMKVVFFNKSNETMYFSKDQVCGHMKFIEILEHNEIKFLEE